MSDQVCNCEALTAARDALAERVVELRDLNANLQAELKALEAAFDESQERFWDALKSAEKATQEAVDWKRLADHWAEQWKVSNSERGTKAIRVEELQIEVDRLKRSHDERVAELEGGLRRVINKRDWYFSQSEAYRAIALAAVGVKP